MSDNRDGLDCILQAINNIVEPKVAKLKYDKTYRAKVTQQIDTGLYMVKINNVEYKLPYNGTLNVGDIVKVKAPLNNFSDIYIEALPGSGGGGGGGGTTDYNDLTNKPVLNSNYSTSQTPNASEIIKGTISLHKISKTGNYNDLLNKPDLDFIPTSEKGKAGGVATLGDDTKISDNQLPIATTTDLGVIKVGANLTISEDGTLNAIGGSGAEEVEIGDTEPAQGTIELWVDTSEQGTGSIGTNTGFSYSTNETLTGGTWINGKPLYRKVFYMSDTTTGSKSIDISNLNYEFIMIKNRYFKSKNFIFTGNRYNASTPDDYIEYYITDNTKQLKINVGTPWTNFETYIVVEYTKTTD